MSCKSGQVLNGSKCINVTDCTLPVLSHRRCLQRCPDGYYYIMMNSDTDDFDYPLYHYTIDDIDQNPCFSRKTYYAIICVVALLNVIYLLLVKMYLSTEKYSTEKLVRICYISTGISIFRQVIGTTLINKVN